MIEKLRNYVNYIFEDMPKTKQAFELKDEIMQNTIDRYNDLIAEGRTEEEAFNAAVSSIGDVSRLVSSMQGNRTEIDMENFKNMEKGRKKSGILVSVAVMMYILSVVPVILLDGTKLEDSLGVCLMFLFVAVATGLLIYNAKTKARFRRTEDTIVDEFKEWQAEKKDTNPLKKSIMAAVWAVITGLNIIISFLTGAWHITWVIFLIGGAVNNIIKACFDLKR